MSDTFLSTVAAIDGELDRRRRDEQKLGLLARTLRWHRAPDAADLAAVLALGKRARRARGAGCWEVERAVLEILCERAEAAHVPFLVEVFQDRSRGRHSDDRRRLALHALSRVAAQSGHEEALRVLEEGLRHTKKDTRGWAIGFLLESYGSLGRTLPQSVLDRLRFLAENDVSPDVRVEAVTALAGLGLADEETVKTVVAKARAQVG